MSNQSFDLSADITIVGGGLVGLSLALLLAKQQRQVLLIEARAPEVTAKRHFDARSIALSLSSKHILQQAGVWQSCEAYAAPIKSIHVSEHKGFGVSRLPADEFQLPELGFVVEVEQLLAQLQQAVAHNPYIQQIAPAKLIALEVTDTAAYFKVKAESEVRTGRSALLMACDGLHSQIRDMLGIRTHVKDYDQCAVVANIGLQEQSQFVAYERFTSDGPIAMLPLTENRYALVWTGDKTSAQEKLNCPDDVFLHDLQQAFGYRLGRLVQVGRRQMFPLKQQIAQTQVLRRAVLLGSAAYHLHPVAGQGLNLCLRDVSTLVEHLAQLSMQDALREFIQVREPDQKRTRGATNALLQLFGNKHLPVFLMRNMGLFTFDLLNRSKRELVNYATGLKGHTLAWSHDE